MMMMMEEEGGGGGRGRRKRKNKHLRYRRGEVWEQQNIREDGIKSEYLIFGRFGRMKVMNSKHSLFWSVNLTSSSPLSWGYRIHKVHLCSGVRPLPHNKCPDYDIKQSDSGAPAMLELWRVWSTPSLPLFPGSLWPRMAATDRVLSMGQIELFDI